MPTSLQKFFSKEGLLIILPSLALVIGAFWLAAQFIKPAPPGEITIATGSKTGAYYGFGARYAAQLAKSGIKVNLVETAGSIENLTLLAGRGRQPVDLAFVQGGVAADDAVENLVSLGRMFMEPVWVFYRDPSDVDRLASLRGKTIAIGPDGSGTQQLARSLLRPSQITPETARFKHLGGTDAAQCLLDADCDAALFVAAPNAKAVKALLANEDIKLMSFRQGEAMTRRFPFLARVTLPEGVIDFVRNIPQRDKTLVAAQAALVAKRDIHPAIIGLLVHAAKQVHEAGGLFQNVGEYPRATDPEFPMSDAAELAYNSGVPFLQRFLPFWLAIFIERMIVLIVPIATILLPLIKIGPWLYEWRVRRRLLHWYGQLKDLEGDIAADSNNERLPEHRAEIERIHDAVSVIPVPLTFSDRFYELRAAVDLVRQRLAAIG